MSIEDELGDAPPIVVKIGGDLISDRARYCEHNFKGIVSIGEEIAKLDSILRRRLIVILGGGYFSHGIALRYDLNDATLATAGSDFSRMTIGAFRMMSTVVDIWRDLGISAYPIQAATQIHLSGDALRLTPAQFSASLVNQIVPVTTGDMVLLPDRSSWPVSGALLAVLLAREIRIGSVLFMTSASEIINQSTDIPPTPMLPHCRKVPRLHSACSLDPP